MVASWMLYCVLVAGLLGLGALAVERALSLAGRPVRWVWAAALAASVALPAALLLAPVRPAPLSPKVTARTAAPGAAEGGIPLRIEDLPGLGTEASPMPALDRPLLVGWASASAALLATVAGLAVLLRRRRRGWTRATVDGTPVVISRDVGPAVVGLLRSEIVLPAWVLDLDPAVRRLMVAHEEEHLRAGDPRLLLAGLALLALMPWNPALWWQLRRLRLAVEVDCDARVLRRAPDVRAYGGLLLEVGRRTSGSWLPVAAFSEPASFLERRIRLMTELRVRTPWTRAALLASLGGLLAVAACEAPHPVSPRPRSQETLMVSETGARIPAPASRDEVAAAVREAFPEVAREGLEQGEFLMFVRTADGAIERTHRGKNERWVPTRRPRGGESDRELVPRNPSEYVTIRPVRAPTVDPDEIAEVQLVMLPAGQVAPTEVQVLWVTKKTPAEIAAAAELPARRPAAGTRPERVEVREVSDTTVTPAVLRRVIQRHFPQYADGTRVPAQPLFFVVSATGEVIRAVEGGDFTTRTLDTERVNSVNIFKGRSSTLPEGSPGVIWVRMWGEEASLD